MKIKILGSGCANCKKLYETTEKAATDMNVKAKLEKVEEFPEIMKYGVMRTPALVIDEKVKVSGRIPSIDEIKKYIQEEQ